MPLNWTKWCDFDPETAPVGRSHSVEHLDQYIAYHESGHAVAVLHSTTMELEKITVTDDGAHVTSRVKSIASPDSKTVLLEKATIACAGMVAGALFQEHRGLHQGFQGDAEGFESDLDKCFGALQHLGMGMHEAYEIVDSTFAFFRREEVWRKVCVLAEHLLHLGRGEVLGDDVRKLVADASSDPVNVRWHFWTLAFVALAGLLWACFG